MQKKLRKSHNKIRFNLFSVRRVNNLWVARVNAQKNAWFKMQIAKEMKFEYKFYFH